MGAELIFRVKKGATLKEIQEISDWLWEKSPTNNYLKTINEDIYLNSQLDLELAKKEGNAWQEYFKIMLGKGSLKVSGGARVEAEKNGVDEEKLLTLWTQAFEELNTQFPDMMRYYIRSCAFVPFKQYYFNHEQVFKITNGGTLFSGINKYDENKEKYDVYMSIFEKLNQKEAA